jgi:ABC-type nitrate/sulfonate/bicarbonate transport system ATPase subunit
MVRVRTRITGACPARERRERARNGLQGSGLDVSRDATKYPSELSGGMRSASRSHGTLILAPRLILMGRAVRRARSDDRGCTAGAAGSSLEGRRRRPCFFVAHSIEERIYLGDRV